MVVSCGRVLSFCVVSYVSERYPEVSTNIVNVLLHTTLLDIRISKIAFRRPAAVKSKGFNECRKFRFWRSYDLIKQYLKLFTFVR